MPESAAPGSPPTGAESYGGPIVTAGGVLFIGATRDEYFRAFDMANGDLLWESRLPAAGYATPVTYRVNGRQFVVQAAGGGQDRHEIGRCLHRLRPARAMIAQIQRSPGTIDRSEGFRIADDSR